MSRSLKKPNSQPIGLPSSIVGGRRKSANAGKVEAKISLTTAPIRSGNQYFEWGFGDTYWWNAKLAVRDCGPADTAINELTRYIAGLSFVDKEMEGRVVSTDNGRVTLRALFEQLSHQAAWFNGAFAIRVKRNQYTGKAVDIQSAHLPDFRRNRDNTGWLYNPWFGDKYNYQQNQQYVFLPDFDPTLSDAEGLALLEETMAINRGEYMGELLYYKGYSVVNEPYPYPPAFNSIEVLRRDGVVAQALLNQGLRGFAPSMVVTMVGNISDENTDQTNTGDGQSIGPSDFAKLVNQVSDMYSPSNPSQAVVLTAPNQESLPDIKMLDVEGLAEKSADIQKGADENVYRLFRVPPVLVGVSTPGALGSREELANNEIIFNGYCTSLRNVIIRTLGLLGIEGIEVIDALQFRYIPDVILSAMTADEQRQYVGLPMLEQKIPDAKQRILEALSTLSPLIATKVLEDMTIDERRALVGLTPVPNPATAI